jgi:molybdopterin molybdotransferase
MSPHFTGAATFFMLSVSEARERIMAIFQPVGLQTVSLEHATGRILAGDITARTNLPLFDNSSVDGFALQAADSTVHQTLQVVADIRAGTSSDIGIQRGECARIMTGAPLPKGAEAVVMLEDTDSGDRNPGQPAPKTVTINKQVRLGENVRRCGDDLHEGEIVLSKGTRLRAQEVGLLAMLGEAEEVVYRRPRLALLSSGDELLPVGAALTSGKIHESNSYALAALAETAGMALVRLGVASDTETDIRSRLGQAVDAKADVIVSSAGVSVGAFDYVKSVVETDGELNFWKVNMRPGKPLAFGNYRGIPFFGLPGNPVSAFVGFEVFVRPALEKLSGMSMQPRPRQKALLGQPIESDGRESYLRAVVSEKDGRLVAHLTGHQGSGNIFSLVRANALLIVPSGVKSLPVNSEVEIWPIA